ncbi:MAG: hypothetical protein PQJ49_13665 [Sphaerochaetaceae bacterium]|jgi:hypothetical protein|nr:hypothetical protein [Sphaerochaetaceae bacterium]MDC7236365.1 hypothetical protein [Sphaerochaetaceae bacterium]MDC7243700.1 hypothetical protein [Sphaerochaetaceae bacterium]MDC7250957.1 hypothetical protein [Sphaerochaetaceae bacterium]
MALKKNDNSSSQLRADKLFSENIKKDEKEKKSLTTFSIEPSFKKSLEAQFDEMGLGWASGIRFALKFFQKNFKFINDDDDM